MNRANFVEWLAENTGLDARIAQMYIRLARLSVREYETVSHFSLKAALDALPKKRQVGLGVAVVEPLHDGREHVHVIAQALASSLSTRSC
jgi:hypothetical protein